MTKSLDKSAYGLKRAHAITVSSHIFVCVAEIPPDATPLKSMVEPYLHPYGLDDAKIAFESRIVENGNWKLVMENNRECYHCAGSHPELCRTFPDQPTAGAGGEFADQAEIEELVSMCEALGLPGRFQKAADHQYRIMRMPFLDDARAMTMSGKPAVAKMLGRVPAEPNVGDILLYHYPSTWNHFTADHALSFRLLPISVDETELVTRWIVRKDAVEGVDYDLKALTEVWLATNAQDTALVEQNQAGIRSPAYEPGPYSPLHEGAVMQFVDWYMSTIRRRLDDTRLRVAAE
jgi:Rieske 2Fe-2S family protein